MLNTKERANPVSEITSNFKVVNQFEYLGIQIVPNLEKTVEINYDKIKQEVNYSIDRWMKLPISVMGRVNVLKMVVLPKLLYLFQYIPLPPPSDVFRWMKKIILSFFLEQW